MKQIRTFCRSFSFLLLLVFSSIQVLQAFHTHSAEKGSATSLSEMHKSSSDHEVGETGINCSICEFYLKRQSPQLHVEAFASLIYFPAKPVTINIDFSRSLYAATVHSWTNKGPPRA